MLYNRSSFSFNGGYCEPDLRCFRAVVIFYDDNQTVIQTRIE